jgi:hypothetical protein
VQTVVEFWLRRLPGLECVGVEVGYPDGCVVMGNTRIEFMGNLGAAMGRLKRMIEDETPGT